MRVNGGSNYKEACATLGSRASIYVYMSGNIEEKNVLLDQVTINPIILSLSAPTPVCLKILEMWHRMSDSVPFKPSSDQNA